MFVSKVLIQVSPATQQGQINKSIGVTNAYSCICPEEPGWPQATLPKERGTSSLQSGITTTVIKQEEFTYINKQEERKFSSLFETLDVYFFRPTATFR